LLKNEYNLKYKAKKDIKNRYFCNFD